MRNKLIVKVLLFFWLLLFFILVPFTSLESKVYIDINSPIFKQLPIAVQEFSGHYGKEISDVVVADLEFTGLFLQINPSAYLEIPTQEFNPKNWSVLGVEIVIKGSVKIEKDKDFIVIVFVYDVFEHREILKKEYQAKKELIRTLSHSIANDIYNKLTGEVGIFRSKIAFIAGDKAEKDIYIMDWDGNRISKIGVKKESILSLRWSRDGNKLIYSARRNREWGIYCLDFVNMKEEKIFTSKGTNILGDFLPNGDEIIISSTKDGTPNIYIIALKEKSKIKKLTSSYGIETSPSISYDGRYITFVSDRGGTPQVYLMEIDGSGAKRITFEGTYNTSPLWSFKEDLIAFVGLKGKNQIFTIKPDGTELKQLTTDGNNEEPSFSPDGRYIVFSSDRNRIKSIYLMRTNGENQKRITPGNMECFGPRWSNNNF